MSYNVYLSWALNKDPNKEHVSFRNFVVNFGLTNKEGAHEAYESLINSTQIRKRRREKLQQAYLTFQQRDAGAFWADRALKTADRMLLVTNATTSKQAGVEIQRAGLQEANSGLKRYPTELSRVESLEILEVSDDSGSEADDKVNSSAIDNLDAQEDQSTPAEIDISEGELSRAKSTPFYDLILYVFKKTRGEAMAVPELPQHFSSMNHCEMAKHALKELGRANEVSKDVLVLLSGIINTLSPGAQTFTLSPKIKSQSLIPSLSVKLPAVETLLSELLLALCPGISEDPHAEATLIGLQAKIWELLFRSAKETPRNQDQKAVRTCLMIMDHICSVLATEQLRPPVSEHVYVSTWSHVFNILFHDSKVRAMPEELVSSASRSCRLVVEEEFGSMNKYTSERKVDVSVRAYVDHTWNTEICIFEFKSKDVSDNLCRQQQRKSVRLNGAILLDLEKRGLDISNSYPIVAEARGLAISFYTLRRYEDVLGAGRSIPSTVWLPSDASQVKQFLKSDSLHILLAFA
ncbi:hypothetical protein BGW41_001419, partial [Actinomortierella wolfii]